MQCSTIWDTCYTSDTTPLGVVFCKTEYAQPSSSLLLKSLVKDLTTISPMNETAEDNEYAFFKNIMDDPAFTCIFGVIFRDCRAHLERYFVSNINTIELSDAFVVSYNEQHFDSTVKKHQDPSDITVNLCLERSDDLSGSEVKFYGTKRLKNVATTTAPSSSPLSSTFVVGSRIGFCTIHFGAHPHEVTPLTKGRRTNVILTYVYKDKMKSEATRTCYATD